MRLVPEGEVNPYENMEVVEVFDVWRSSGQWRTLTSLPEFRPLILHAGLMESGRSDGQETTQADPLQEEEADSLSVATKRRMKAREKSNPSTFPLDCVLQAPTTLRLRMANTRDGQKVLRMMRAQKKVLFGDSSVVIRYACLPVIRIVSGPDPTLAQAYEPRGPRDADQPSSPDLLLAPDIPDASQLLSGLSSLWLRDYLAETKPVTLSQDGLICVDLIFPEGDFGHLDLLRVLEDINQSIAATSYSMVAFLIPAEVVQQVITTASWANAKRPTTPNAKRPTTPNAARATTPNAARATTPNAARATTPNAKRPTTPNAKRPTTPNAARATTPNAARATTPNAGKAAKAQPS